MRSLLDHPWAKKQASKQMQAVYTTLLMQDLSLKAMQDLSDGPAIPTATETMLQ